MEEQIEAWELGSGTWLRDPVSEEWCLFATPGGTVVDPGFPAHDLARLIQARRDPKTGQWFPPDFRYSLHTGAPLQVPTQPPESSWVPPFGGPAPAAAQRAAGGVRRTPMPLALARANELSAGTRADRTLPPLPRGQYRFVADRFDVASPTLLAVEPEQGKLLVLLPEKQQWMPMEPAEATNWAQRLRNPRGWRMELVHVHGHATAYCPSVTGLAAITPRVFGLRYAVEYTGAGAALGGPVAWGHEIWMPLAGNNDTVDLVGKVPRSAGHGHTMLPTPAPAPVHGFEAPVFDDLHVVWPCDEGQLVLRLDENGEKRAEWFPWPEHVKPVFTVGSPYTQQDGTFWQLCRRSDAARLVHVPMAGAPASAATQDAPGLCTGQVCYRGTWRTEDGPWQAAPAVEAASTDVVLPLLESAHDGAVLGLRMGAPHGVLALLQAGNEPRRAILQLEVRGRPALSFGAIAVRRPWFALPFVHDRHLWIHHPDMAQALGWELAVQA